MVRASVCFLLMTGLGWAGAAAAAAQEPASTPEAPPPPRGQVIFERRGDPASPAGRPNGAVGEQAAPPADAVPDIGDADRAALRFTAYDLDARVEPATSTLAMRARVTVENTGTRPLSFLTLPVASSRRWSSVTLVAGGVRTPLPLAQHGLETDADHTGKCNEAVVTLPAKLAPGASVVLDTFYEGPVVADASRLTRLGASAAAAAETDWDAIGPLALPSRAPAVQAPAALADSPPVPLEIPVALRGFGDVLWYPVSQPQLFLGQGAQLFDAAGRLKLAGRDVRVHLRLSVEYTGDPPAAAYFCGRRLALKALSDTPDEPIASSLGVATADFAEEPLGFRAMSLFVVEQPEVLLPATREASSPDPSLAVETAQEALLPLLLASAQDSARVLHDWLGLEPLTSLAVLDHAGQPFEDGPLLVAPLQPLAGTAGSSAMTYSLTHAWIDTGVPWIDDGLAEFFILLSTERTHGREQAVAQLEELLQPLALAEVTPPPPENGAAREHEDTAGANAVASGANAVAAGPKTGPEPEPLPDAWNDVFYRRKAAAVWWMLRDLAGEQPLRAALEAWRLRPPSHTSADAETRAFEALLEKTSGKDLGWFFNDWVLRDLGLPDLSLGEVTPRELVASTGRKTGWLVSVTVRNDGAAAADVPLTVEANSLTATQRMRVPGFGTATARVLIEGEPTAVVLNDGTVPEQRTSRHTKALVLRKE